MLVRSEYIRNVLLDIMRTVVRFSSVRKNIDDDEGKGMKCDKTHIYDSLWHS